MPFQEHSKFRVWLNRYLWAMTLAFGLSSAVTVMSLYQTYKGDLETYFTPVFVDRTATDWQRAEDGTWSAVVFLNKVRAGCVYLPEQIETAIAVNPDGTIVESRISYVEDDTPGSNRPTGWQRLDNRVRLNNPLVQEGATIWGNVLHECSDDGRPP